MKKYFFEVYVLFFVPFVFFVVKKNKVFKLQMKDAPMPELKEDKVQEKRI